MNIKLCLPLPPSLGTLYKKWRNRVVLSPEGKQYKKDIFYQVKSFSGKIDAKDKLSVDLILVFPDHRRRDTDNYRKILFDSLTYAHIWHDDSQVAKDDARKIVIKGEKKAYISISLINNHSRFEDIIKSEISSWPKP